MKRWLNVASQFLLGTGTIYTLMEPSLTDQHKLWIQVSLATAQLAISSVAHSYNPDGTSASVSYNPKLEKDRATVLKMLEEQKKRNAS